MMISKEMFVKWFDELTFLRTQRNEVLNRDDDADERDVVIVNYDSFASGMLNDLMGVRPEDCMLFYFSYVNAINNETGELDKYDISDASKMYDFICNVYPNVTVEW
jgi:hypothetical protein